MFVKELHTWCSMLLLVLVCSFKKPLPKSINTFVVERHTAIQELCDKLAQGSHRTTDLHINGKCGQKSIGNHLAVIYMFRLVAASAKITVKMGCSKPGKDEAVQAQLPHHINGNNPNSPITMSWREACKLCRLRWVHECDHGLEHMARPIQVDMQRLAKIWQSRNRDVELDDAVIHVRCFTGDFEHYGFLPYSVYTGLLPQSVRRIGILTIPLPLGCGNGSTWTSDTCGNFCGDLIHDLQRFLQSTFPQAEVTIRDGDSPVGAYSRMVLADYTICSPSTFCLFPTLATHGTGYIVDTPLYPWVRHVRVRHVLDHLQMVYTPFLSQARIARSKFDTKGISACLRANGTCEDLRYQRRTQPMDWGRNGTH